MKNMSKNSYTKPKKVSKETLNLTEENLENLKKLFPLVFSEGKIDFEKLKILLGDEIEERVEKYNFTWAGKSDAFRNLQTTASGTLILDENDSVDFDKTGNLFIEGDNLEVLKLLQKSYQNKIKMIYIDPPYNTGKDFVYKDNFKDSIGNYEKITGQVDEEGNRTDTNKETNGRFHSDWLTMMYPRLYLAKNLLKEDGVIFVSIDDHEVHNLRKIMDDIFGEENFVSQLVWRKKAGGANDSRDIAVEHEYIICYSKSEKNGIYKLPLKQETIKNYKYEDDKIKTHGKYGLKDLNDPSLGDSSGLHYDIKCPDESFLKKDENQWKCNEKTFLKRMTDNRIVFKKIKGRWKVFYKIYLNEEKGELRYNDEGNIIQKGRNLSSLLYSVALNKVGNDEIKKLFEEKPFDYPKPTPLIKVLIQTAASNKDIILDFFAGSGTTAHAVLDLNKDGGNRKFICVQLPEKTDEKSEAYKAGYKTIAEIAKERIRRVIEKIKKEDKDNVKNMDLGFKVFKLTKSNYRIWKGYEGKDEKELLKQMELFQSPLIAGYKKINLIYEVGLKEQGYSLNSEVEEMKNIKSNKVFKVSDEDRFFYICLDDKIREQTIKDLKLGKETMFVCLDESLDDNQKINLSLKINLRSV